SGLACTAGGGGTCRTCGGVGQGCCEGSTCANGGCCDQNTNVCVSGDGGFCSGGQGTCLFGGCQGGTCGRLGQNACAGGVSCTAPLTRQLGPICQPCGGAGERCCNAVS